MRVAVFSSKSYDKTFFEAANAGKHQFIYLESRLDSSTALSAEGSQAVCVFVNNHPLDRLMRLNTAKSNHPLRVNQCHAHKHNYSSRFDYRASFV